MKEIELKGLRKRREKHFLQENGDIVAQVYNEDIHYLEDGKYVMHQSYILQDDKEEEDYNAEQVICLKSFPHIKIVLGEIFEGVK